MHRIRIVVTEGGQPAPRMAVGMHLLEGRRRKVDGQPAHTEAVTNNRGEAVLELNPPTSARAAVITIRREGDSQETAPLFRQRYQPLSTLKDGLQVELSSGVRKMARTRPAGTAEMFRALVRANDLARASLDDIVAGRMEGRSAARNFARKHLGRRPRRARRPAFFVPHGDDAAPVADAAVTAGFEMLQRTKRRGLAAHGTESFDPGEVGVAALEELLTVPLAGRLEAAHPATRSPCEKRNRAREALEPAAEQGTEQVAAERAPEAGNAPAGQADLQQRLSALLATDCSMGSLPARPTEREIASSLGQELRAGPADVPAYYDYPVLYTAWKDTWTAVSDSGVAGDLEDLYESMVQLVAPEYLEPLEEGGNYSPEATELEELLLHLGGVNSAVAGALMAPAELLAWTEVEGIAGVWGALTLHEQNQLLMLHHAWQYATANRYRPWTNVDPGDEEPLTASAKARKVGNFDYAYWEEFTDQARFMSQQTRLNKVDSMEGLRSLDQTHVLDIGQPPPYSDDETYVARLHYIRQSDRTLRDIADFDDYNPDILPGESIWSLGNPVVNANPAIRAARNLVETANKSIQEGGRVGTLGRAQHLINKLQRMADKPYQFDVFAAGTCNFGLLINYRQRWQPLAYQAGNLAGSIPLAPAETRSFEVRRSSRAERTRTWRQATESGSSSESGSTARSEGEIAQRVNSHMAGGAEFDALSRGGFLGNGGEVTFGGDFSADMKTESSQTKQTIQELTRKAAQEYRDERSIEVTDTTAMESSYTTRREISNPNNELTVTYLFYELQRRFEVSQRLHDLTPVVLVAFDVPEPKAIDEAFLQRHAWILREVLLDRQLLPTLNMLTDGFIGDEVDVEILEEQWKLQLAVVSQLRSQLYSHLDLRDEARAALVRATQEVRNVPDADGKKKKVGQELAQQLLGEAAEEEAARQSLDWADLDLQKAEASLRDSMNALERATMSYTTALRARLDQRNRLDQLILHVKDNILHYMQAIWLREPGDQRYLRLYDIRVPWPEKLTMRPTGKLAETLPGLPPRVGSRPGPAAGVPGHFLELEFEPAQHHNKRWLHEVAELDTILGFRGNYAAFRAREPNAITTYMLQDFLDSEFGVLDPDPSGELPTAREAMEIARCLWNEHATSDAERDEIAEWLVQALDAAQTISQEIVVPTGELFIEALPGTHPVLEDYKLRHRAADARKVELDVATSEVELLRRAGRILKEDLTDPDIDRSIRIEGSATGIHIDSE